MSSCNSVFDIKVKKRYINTIKRFKLDPELNGQATNNILKIPATLHRTHWQELEQNDIEKLLHHIKLLEEFSVQWEPKMTECLETFWWLKQKFARSERLINLLEVEDDDNDDIHTPVKWAKMFSSFGGVKALLRFIMSHTVLPAVVAAKQETASVLKLKGITLELLYSLCVENEEIASDLVHCDDVMHCLFGLLQYTSTCVIASKMIECLLLSKKNPLDLSKIENLTELVSEFEEVQLANFCKILAITLSDLDTYEHKSLLFAQMKQKKSENFHIRDVNQDVILNIPNIMEGIVKIACAKPYIPCFPNVKNETEQWVHWIDNQVQEEIANNQDKPFISGISQWSTTNGALMGPEAAIQISTELSFRANAVCVLGLLLVGKHRRKVQKQLTELCLIPQISELFDHFVWRWNMDHNRLPGHNASCECSPEVALKIQVLRLIHSFCDHSEYKHAMLSWSEYSELKKLEDASKITNRSNVCLERSQMCVGSRGLLTKIVQVMRRETTGSTFRFWLSRAIESYLRESTTSADQDFLIRRGLLEHVGTLVTSNIRQKEVLQSSFDLLGELVKFNEQAFHRLDKVLDTGGKQKKLLSLINGSLVDSNMFIRSLVLSYEHFLSLNNEDTKNYAVKQCFLLKHVSELRQRAKYLQKLISLITVDTLTQENVSCLNTALVILIFAYKSGEIERYLEILNVDDDEDDCPFASIRRPSYIQNLYDLLTFWQNHYLQKDNDYTVLEKSSRIAFQEWQNVVTILTSNDSTNPSSLMYRKFPPLIKRAY